MYRDHKVVVITISQTEKGSKSSRLYNTWLEDPTFLELARVGLTKRLNPLEGMVFLSLTEAEQISWSDLDLRT